MLGQLLNNHPNMVITNEYHFLSHILRKSYSDNTQTLYGLCGMASQTEQRDGSILSSGYPRPIFGKLDPRGKKIHIVGDKGGGTIGLHVNEHGPQVLEKVLGRYRVCLLHVIRNPFDIISSICIRYAAMKYGEGLPYCLGIQKVSKSMVSHLGEEETMRQLHKHLDYSIKYFFDLADAVKKVKKVNKMAMLDIHHEAFLKQPDVQMSTILRFLGMKVVDWMYCLECVKQSKPVHKSRLLFPKLFNPERIAQVEKHASRYDWLRDYRHAH